jgi:RNA polymerase sigma factor (sigma-70 family)
MKKRPSIFILNDLIIAISSINAFGSMTTPFPMMKDVFLIANDDGVSRVRPSLISGDYIDVVAEKIDDFTFPFISPLSADDNCDRHDFLYTMKWSWMNVPTYSTKFDTESQDAVILALPPFFKYNHHNPIRTFMAKTKLKSARPKSDTNPSLKYPVPSQRALDSRAEDSQLIAGALKGNQAAYRTIVKKYHDPIYNLLYKMIRQKDEVEDLTQEAFIKAFGSLSNFNNEFAFSTWLFKIAQNNCIDYIRKRKLQTFSIDKPIESKDGDYGFEIPDSSYEPDRELIARQRTKLLEEAIQSLPAKYRMVIIMRHSEEKDYQEIAKALKLPIGTVKAHIFRAREMLNKALRSKIHQY